ncbi:MAG: HslU--HslV peptidase ATPase subunit [Epsilonproteobacteria bacterium]|nr:HslU--HslV peptidase ATPase subunit [Campylobacterota bacterium]
MSENLTPKEIVAYLDKYIVGQDRAKKVIAIALRNRWRRMQLDEEMRQEVTPKNILMIGSTGVGKTEIARRLAKLMKLPFIKVEASKFTEVGFVGRDVESIIRDLAIEAIHLVKDELTHKYSQKIGEYIEEKILNKLLPPLPFGASEEKKMEYEKSKVKMLQKLRKGELDNLKIEIELPHPSIDISSYGNVPPEMANVQESILKVLGGLGKKGKKKEVSIKEAKKLLKQEALENLIDEEEIKKLAQDRVQSGGVVFIDEIDKIATPSNTTSRQDPSKEGVQRDLLPIIEGSIVNTKLGPIKTDHILFIAAGAFHLSKPSDLIPELQGRFPLRVELNSLDEDALYKILKEPKNSLIKQYQALLSTEGVTLTFLDEAIRAIAKYSALANQKSEDIGARRLHTVLEKLLEDISFDAPSHKGKEIIIDEKMVKEKLEDIVESEDLTKYIL